MADTDERRRPARRNRKSFALQPLFVGSTTKTPEQSQPPQKDPTSLKTPLSSPAGSDAVVAVVARGEGYVLTRNEASGDSRVGSNNAGKVDENAAPTTWRSGVASPVNNEVVASSGFDEKQTFVSNHRRSGNGREDAAPLMTPLPNSEPLPGGDKTSERTDKLPETSILLRLFDRLNTPQQERSRSGLQNTPTWKKLREPDSVLEAALASAHKALDGWDEQLKQQQNGVAKSETEQILGSERRGEQHGPGHAIGGDDTDDDVSRQNEEVNIREQESRDVEEERSIVPRLLDSRRTEERERAEQARLDKARHVARMRALNEEEQAHMRMLKQLKRSVQRGLRDREILDIQQSIINEAYGSLLDESRATHPKSGAVNGEDADNGDHDTGDDSNDDRGSTSRSRAQSKPTRASAVNTKKHTGKSGSRSWSTVARRRVLLGVRKMAAAGKELEEMDKTLHKLRQARDAASNRFRQLVAVRCATQVVLEEQDELAAEAAAVAEATQQQQQQQEQSQNPQAMVGTESNVAMPENVKQCLERLGQLRGGKSVRRDIAPLDMASDTTALDLLRFLAQGPIVNSFAASSGVGEARERGIKRQMKLAQRAAILHAGALAPETPTQFPLPHQLNHEKTLAFDEYPSDENTTSSEDNDDQSFPTLPGMRRHQHFAYENQETMIVDLDAFDDDSSTDEEELDGTAGGRQRMLPVTEGLRAALDIVAP
eukprot:INCI6707.1.p1 GENE.INCI6707.1~~INCI6707.1.p1  ORF type:complete len:763 (-),score=159.22 INCI6707.1:141-2282(-)